VGSISTQRNLYRGDSLVPIHHLPVPGGNWWMGKTETFLIYQNTAFEFVASTTSVRPIVQNTGCNPLFFINWCDSLFFKTLVKSIQTPLIEWKQEPGIQYWISKVCFLISRNCPMEEAFYRWKFKPKSASSILQALSCRFCRFRKLSNQSKFVISKKSMSRIALLVHLIWGFFQM